MHGVKYGAENIGLYRTEFPFIIRDAFPSEDEQVEIYEKILLGAEGKTVTIRTLDLGGDKFLSYFDAGKEEIHLENVLKNSVESMLGMATGKNVQLETDSRSDATITPAQPTA